MKTLIQLHSTDFKFGCSELLDDKITSSLRKNISRCGNISTKEVLELAGNPIFKKCAFCDEEVKRFIYTFDILSDNIVDVLTTRNKKNSKNRLLVVKISGIKLVDELQYCKTTNCPGKKLNPNSVEFVAKTRNLSNEDALILIKNRNKSPFYKENHKSLEDYDSYQNIFKRLEKTHNLDKIIEKQNYSRSLTGYIEKYGDDANMKWKLVQSQKAITVQNLSRIYEIEDAKVVRDKWVYETRHTLENFIRRYGDEGPAKFQAYLDTSKFFSYHHPTGIVRDGIDFYSKMEVAFYDKLKASDFKWRFQHDKRYPNSLMRSDFYFPLIDTHLEIAGAWHISGYAEKMQLKSDKFSPIIVKNIKDYDTIIHNLIKAHNELSRY